MLNSAESEGRLDRFKDTVLRTKIVQSSVSSTVPGVQKVMGRSLLNLLWMGDRHIPANASEAEKSFYKSHEKVTPEALDLWVQAWAGNIYVLKKTARDTWMDIVRKKNLLPEGGDMSALMQNPQTLDKIYEGLRELLEERMSHQPVVATPQGHSSPVAAPAADTHHTAPVDTHGQTSATGSDVVPLVVAPVDHGNSGSDASHSSAVNVHHNVAPDGNASHSAQGPAHEEEGHGGHKEHEEHEEHDEHHDDHGDHSHDHAHDAHHGPSPELQKLIAKANNGSWSSMGLRALLQLRGAIPNDSPHHPKPKFPRFVRAPKAKATHSDPHGHGGHDDHGHGGGHGHH